MFSSITGYETNSIQQDIDYCEHAFVQLEQEVQASYHAVKRARQRLGLKAVSAEKTIQMAYDQGLGAEDFTDREKVYLQRKMAQGSDPRIYNGSCYIFSNSGVCITVFKVPGWFGRRQYFDGKKKIRDPRNYCRFNGVVL